MSSDYRIKLLDFRRNEPPDYILCRANNRRLCSGIIEYEASFMYVAGGKHLRRRIPMCPKHAFAFARRHGLLLPIMSDRARKILEATEKKMTYRIRHADGRLNGGHSLRTIVTKVQKSFSLGFAMAADRALFPMEDLEVDDVIAGTVKIYEDWPENGDEPTAWIEKEDDLETTRANGIAGSEVNHG